MKGLDFNQEVEINNSGVKVRHWSLIKVTINYPGNHAKLVFVGYNSKEEREQGKNRADGAVLPFTVTNKVDSKDFKDFMDAQSNNEGLKRHLKKAVKQFLITAEEDGVFANSPED